MSNDQVLTNKPLFGAQLDFSHPLTKGLVGCWLLNDNGYRAFDSSPYKNHGTLAGFDSPPSRTTSGIKFDGSNDNIVLPSILIGNRKVFTIITWFKSTSVVSGDRLYAEANTTTNTPLNFLSINRTVAGDVAFGIRDNAGIGGSLDGGTNSNDGNWHFAGGISRHASLREVYYDGVKINTNTTTLSTITVNNAKIGAQERTVGIENPFEGTIGMVLAYITALSENDMKQHYINPYSMFI